MKAKKGVTLIAAIFVLLIMVLLAITISTVVSSDAVIAVKNYYSLDAFYIANAGMQYYIKQLDDDGDWNSPPSERVKDFSGGRFVVITTDESKHQITFSVIGLLTVEGKTFRREIEPLILRTSGGLSEILEEYAIYWGGSGAGVSSSLGNNVTIIGDMFVDSDLIVGTNSLISGDVYATQDISYSSGSSASGTTETYVEPPSSPPTLETTVYDDQLAVADTYPAGNVTYSKNDTHILVGTTYINGDMTVGQDAALNVTGLATIVVTGAVTIMNNVILDNNLTIIAAGLIDIDNNVIIGPNCLLYSSVGFDVGNNAATGSVDLGEGTQLITPGDVEFGNNIEYYGFMYVGGDFTQTGNNFYYEGNLMVAGDMQIDNNTTIVLNSGLVTEDDLVGITGGESGGSGTEGTLDVIDWSEVY